MRIEPVADTDRARRGVRHGARLRLDCVHEPERRRPLHAAADGGARRRALAQGAAAVRGRSGDRRAPRPLRAEGRRHPGRAPRRGRGGRDARHRRHCRPARAVPASRTIGREVLADELRKAGAQVTEVVAYRTVPQAGRDGEPDIYKMLLERQIAAVTFTSASSVRHFVQRARRGPGRRPAADDGRRVDWPGDGRSRAAAGHRLDGRAEGLHHPGARRTRSSITSRPRSGTRSVEAACMCHCRCRAVRAACDGRAALRALVRETRLSPDS